MFNLIHIVRKNDAPVILSDQVGDGINEAHEPSNDSPITYVGVNAEKN